MIEEEYRDMYHQDSANLRTDNNSDIKKVISIAGGKGGVGKTVLTASMGIALANRGYKTVVIDADFGGANLHQALGLFAPALTIRDFIARTENNINNLLLETPIKNLFLLAGSPGTLGGANTQYWIKRKILRHIKKIDAEYILLDIGAGAAFDQLDYFNFADFGCVVILPEPLSIQDGYNFIKLSLYRLLYRRFFKIVEIKKLFLEIFALENIHHHKHFQYIEDRAKLSGQIIRDQWDSILKSFKPVIIMNMMENKQDLFEAVALKVAAYDLLKLNLVRFASIKNDPNIRRAFGLMRPDLLLLPDSEAAQDIQRTIDLIFFGKETKESIEYHLQNKAKFKTPSFTEEEVICSVHCTLWNKCSAQNGGYPCRIKAVGYISQQKEKKMFT